MVVDLNIVRRVACAILCLTGVSFGDLKAGPAYDTKRIQINVLDGEHDKAGYAKVYRSLPLTFDQKSNSVRISRFADMRGQSDANGIYAFDLQLTNTGDWMFITNQSYTKMGYLRLFKDSPEQITVHLYPPAYIDVVIPDSIKAIGVFNIELMYQEISEIGRSNFPCLTLDCAIKPDQNDVSFRIPCPADCRMFMRAVANKYFYDIERVIPPLKTGQIYYFGEIDFRPVPGSFLVGKVPPPLFVSDWVLGEPIKLSSLRGKVVLLFFWGLWDPLSVEDLSKVAELRKKYPREVLEIIGIHDTSMKKEQIIAYKTNNFSVLDIPFRIAIDAPADVVGRGRGSTIEGYGMNVPGYVLISQDGLVEGVGENDLENRINNLLYGNSLLTKAKKNFSESSHFRRRRRNA